MNNLRLGSLVIDILEYVSTLEEQGMHTFRSFSFIVELESP